MIQYFIRFWVILLAITFLFASCKKEEKEKPVPAKETQCLLVEKVWLSSYVGSPTNSTAGIDTLGVYTYQYNSLNQISSISYRQTVFTNSYQASWQYSYNSNGQLTRVKEYMNNEWVGVADLGYDSQGLVSQLSYDVISTVSQFNYKLTYDNAANLVEVKSNSKDNFTSTLMQYKYNNGNVVEVVSQLISSRGKGVDTTRFEYYPDKVNKAPTIENKADFYLNFDHEIRYQEGYSKNLVKKRSAYRFGQGYLPAQNYRYEFNEWGYVTKQIWRYDNEANGDYELIYAYKYNCF